MMIKVEKNEKVDKSDGTVNDDIKKKKFCKLYDK